MKLINTAKKSNVAIFPIDVRGMMASAPGGDASTKSASGAQAGMGGGRGGAANDTGQETLSTMASDAGGRLCAEDNDLTLGMEQDCACEAERAGCPDGEALVLGDPITDLNLALEWNYFWLARDRYFIPLSVKIPGSEIALAKNKGSAKTDLGFVGELRDTKDQARGMVRDGVTIQLAKQTVEELSSRSIADDTGFTAPPASTS